MEQGQNRAAERRVGDGENDEGRKEDNGGAGTQMTDPGTQGTGNQ